MKKGKNRRTERVRKTAGRSIGEVLTKYGQSTDAVLTKKSKKTMDLKIGMKVEVKVNEARYPIDNNSGYLINRKVTGEILANLGDAVVVRDLDTGFTLTEMAKDCTPI